MRYEFYVYIISMNSGRQMFKFVHTDPRFNIFLYYIFACVDKIVKQAHKNYSDIFYISLTVHHVMILGK